MADEEFDRAWVFGYTRRAGIIVTAIGIVLLVASVLGYGALFLRGTVPLPSPLVVLSALVLTLVTHELVHGLGFAIVGVRPRFSAGFRGGLPYLFTTSPGNRLEQLPMLLVGVLPLVLVDLVGLALGPFPPAAVIGLVIFAANTSGAGGDLWLLALISRSQPGTLFEAAEGPEMVAWRRRGPSADDDPARSV
jgi:hypothetical protein